ncbi:unnamed protein product [Vitrella brassicaformis CCMP3155]|uniref:Uncharacterized protein n=1 Tax=Vitrella brassicaformis (strain CCMP3155) TaxID=1169540 RepID=A0A0G4EIQ0_VITBC|nr:unnamed protein product [Vitrella brassicaformis CCMP3155]|eukprot:CEL95890.1 unnamed protein product [Vitrella brassicaformis CCMP3155]
MGRFLRMAFIYRLTPNATRPLRLSADSLPTATAFHQLPLAMAIYKTFGHQLTHTGVSLALQQSDDGLYRIGNEFWSHEEGVGHRRVLAANIGRDNRRYGRLLRTDAITEDQGIAVDFRFDRGNRYAANAEDCHHVIVSGFRPNESVVAYISVEDGDIDLWTTEAPTAVPPASLTDRFPTSEPLWRCVLRRFELESDVIDRRRVVG